MGDIGRLLLEERTTVRVQGGSRERAEFELYESGAGSSMADFYALVRFSCDGEDFSADRIITMRQIMTALRSWKEKSRSRFGAPVSERSYLDVIMERFRHHAVPPKRIELLRWLVRKIVVVWDEKDQPLLAVEGVEDMPWLEETNTLSMLASPPPAARATLSGPLQQHDADAFNSDRQPLAARTAPTQKVAWGPDDAPELEPPSQQHSVQGEEDEEEKEAQEENGNARQRQRQSRTRRRQKGVSDRLLRPATSTGPRAERAREEREAAAKKVHKSFALDQNETHAVREGAVATEDRQDWSDDRWRLTFELKRSQEDLERAKEEQRKKLAIARERQRAARAKMVRMRNQQQHNGRDQRWVATATSEVIGLHQMSTMMETELRRAQASAQRETQRAVWGIQPFRERRGRYRKGPYLGSGPLPVDALANKKGAAERMAEKYEWDSNGRRRLRDPEREFESAAAAVMEQIKEFAQTGLVNTLDLLSVFREYDADGNGTIEKSEFYDAMRGMGVRATADELRTIWNYFDPNGDGKIVYGEFVTSFYNRRGMLREEAAKTRDEEEHAADTADNAAASAAEHSAASSSTTSRKRSQKSAKKRP